MAITVTPITKITIDSKNFQEYNDTSKSFLPRMDANVYGQADQLLGRAERVLQSTINAFEAFNTNLRKTAQTDNLTDPNNPIYAGRFSQSAYINPADTPNALKALQSAFNSKIDYASVGNTGFDITSEGAVLINLTKNFKNKRAQMKAIEELDKIGGTVDIDSAKTKKNPYRSVLSVPMSLADYDAIINNNTPQGANKILTKYINDAMPMANKENRIEASKQRDIKKEKEAKEEERQKKQKEREDKEAERQEERKKEKEEAEARRKATSNKVKTLAVLTTLVNLVRRIAQGISKIFGNAIQSKEDAITGHELNLTLQEVRRYKFFDLAHGMNTGATISAMASLQGAFGDTKNMDEQKLSKLAVVTRGHVADLAHSGIGGKEPDKLLGTILDDYFNLYLQGINSSNVQVGRSDARRELTTNLRNAGFPDVAEVFSRMVEDYESGIYKDQFNNWASWLNTYKTNQYGLSDHELNAFKDMGSLLTSVNAKFRELVDTYLTDFALSLGGLVQKVDNIQFGKPPSEKDKTNRENREKNEAASRAMKTQRDSAKARFESEFQDTFGIPLSDTGLTIEDFSNYDNVSAQDMSPEAQNLRKYMSMIIYGNHPELVADIASYGEYSFLYQQAMEQANKTSGKVSYNKLDYLDYRILAKIGKRIKTLTNPSDANLSANVDTFDYKNLMNRIKNIADYNPTEEEMAMLGLGLEQYLGTWNLVDKFLKEDVGSDFIDNIALLYNKTHSDTPVDFYRKNLSKKGREQLRQAWENGSITDEEKQDMLLQAYINMIAGNTYTVPKASDNAVNSFNAAMEVLQDKATVQALGDYATSALVTKALVKDILAGLSSGYRLLPEASAYINSDKREIEVTLYKAKGDKKEKVTTVAMTYDSSKSASVTTDISDLIE